MSNPRLLEAPHHPDPYPFYAALRAAHPSGLHHDAEHHLWVVSSAAAVEEVFMHPSLRVRPPAEPVPKSIAGSPAGTLFGGLMRQNDGALHQQGKAWATQSLGTALPIEDIARKVVAEGESPRHRALNALMFEAPVLVVWRLLYPEVPQPTDLARKVREVLAAWSPTADDTARHTGSAAAAALLQCLDGQANRVGLLTQTCEATAGLIGAVLIALQREPGLRARWLADASLDEALASEAGRHDPPTQNTRRFAAEPCQVRGHALQAGEALLVLLASANRDTTGVPDAERFVLQRPAPRNFVWGLGAHACPGASLSRRIAMGLVRPWHEDGSPIQALTAQWHHRPSPNGRLASFGTD